MDIFKRIPIDRESVFPNLFAIGYSTTSREDLYNCIAWAAGEQNINDSWNPFCIGTGYYWPQGLQRNADLDTFIKLFEMECGYVPCETGSLEPGIEKIAIYLDSNDEVSHAARQLEDGAWTSKLGDWEDIQHKTPDALCGPSPAYGRVAKYLKRTRKK